MLRGSLFPSEALQKTCPFSWQQDNPLANFSSVYPVPSLNCPRGVIEFVWKWVKGYWHPADKYALFSNVVNTLGEF
jgi:hypothetical protein